LSFQNFIWPINTKEKFINYKENFTKKTKVQYLFIFVDDAVADVIVDRSEFELSEKISLS